jgi:hypothetical protein
VARRTLLHTSRSCSAPTTRTLATCSSHIHVRGDSAPAPATRVKPASTSSTSTPYASL